LVHTLAAIVSCYFAIQSSNKTARDAAITSVGATFLRDRIKWLR
jgi:hypothetical protein